MLPQAVVCRRCSCTALWTLSYLSSPTYQTLDTNLPPPGCPPSPAKCVRSPPLLGLLPHQVLSAVYNQLGNACFYVGKFHKALEYVPDSDSVRQLR